MTTHEREQLAFALIGWAVFSAWVFAVVAFAEVLT
jgi:hypothetical protein